MTVNITISEVSGADSLPDTVDFENVTPGEETGVQDLFIRHDATVNPITDCAWYVTRYTGSNYQGENADDDFIEIMGWGDDSLGGFVINQVVPPSWTTGTQFSESNDQVFKNGYGDIDSQLILDEDSISIGTPSGDGEIPVAGEAHVQVRYKIPSSIESAGYRAIQLTLAYSATS